MLKRLAALFAVLVLLLPSSLAAVVFNSALELCLGQEVTSSCCCSHSENPAEQQGPALERGCCCEIDAPQSPPEQPSPARLLGDSGSDESLQTCLTEPFVLFHADPSASLPLRVKVPPRAPPRPLFLYFQSFLI